MTETPPYALLDAGERGFDAAAMRDWARVYTPAANAGHVSRSYREPFALVAWSEWPVGVDIERLEPLDRTFAESICTPQERAELNHRLGDPTLVASLWCSKEALSKALGDAVAYDPRRLDSPLLWRDGVSGAWRAAELPVPDGHVAWICWRTN